MALINPFLKTKIGLIWERKPWRRKGEEERRRRRGRGRGRKEIKQVKIKRYGTTNLELELGFLVWILGCVWLMVICCTQI